MKQCVTCVSGSFHPTLSENHAWLVELIFHPCRSGQLLSRLAWGPDDSLLGDGGCLVDLGMLASTSGLHPLDRGQCRLLGCDNHKCLQTWANVLWEGKTAPS